MCEGVFEGAGACRLHLLTFPPHPGTRMNHARRLTHLHGSVEPWPKLAPRPKHQRRSGRIGRTVAGLNPASSRPLGPTQEDGRAREQAKAGCTELLCSLA